MNFFLKKILIKFSCNYWPLSFCKISKNSSIFCHFRAQNGPFVLNKFFLVQKNFKKFFCTKKKNCLGQMGHFGLENGRKWKNFFEIIIITFIYLLAFFIVQNLKKFLILIQSYEDAPILGPKWSICPKQKFFWKIINIILIYLLAPFIV